ncbi:hypothetical protein HPP92_007500 [Vanilla planifolia]|uniref:Uncharacterized protein n=1 Tax=Vanilla planifolia TaxID=51239 RepID=A0A835RCS4_VANPL|nr:hypothetical protein HPP92_007500 [Vanilla planifolia]
MLRKILSAAVSFLLVFMLITSKRTVEESIPLRMEVPIGFLAYLWSFMSFLPFFFLLLFLGVCKGAIIGPVVALLVFVGNSAVIIGLWPAHFFWTYYCLVKTQKLGLVLKMLLLLFLPFPLFLWPVVGILGSLLVGIGYGFFAPLFATFEAVGDELIDKLYHCFTDGGKDTIKGACTLVRDFTDMCFFSYFSIMDDISEKVNQIAFLCAGFSSWSSY